MLGLRFCAYVDYYQCQYVRYHRGKSWIYVGIEQRGCQIIKYTYYIFSDNTKYLDNPIKLNNTSNFIKFGEGTNLVHVKYILALTAREIIAIL